MIHQVSFHIKDTGWQSSWSTMVYFHGKDKDHQGDSSILVFQSLLPLKIWDCQSEFNFSLLPWKKRVPKVIKVIQLKCATLEKTSEGQCLPRSFISLNPFLDLRIYQKLALRHGGFPACVYGVIVMFEERACASLFLPVLWMFLVYLWKVHGFCSLLCDLDKENAKGKAYM